MTPQLRTVEWRAIEARELFHPVRGAYGGLRLRDGASLKLVDSVRKRVRELHHPRDSEKLVPVVNLSGIRYANDLEALCELVTWPNDLGTPIVVWFATSPEEKVLQLAFRLRWEGKAEVMEQIPDKPEQPLLFSCEDGLFCLGQLTDGLRMYSRVLARKRLLTYHHLRQEEESPKRLGKVLQAFSELGWVRPRGYAPVSVLRTLGVGTGRGRPQVWESVPALARALWREHMKRAVEQYLLF